MISIILVLFLGKFPMLDSNFLRATVLIVPHTFINFLILLNQPGYMSLDMCVMGTLNLLVGCFGTHPCLDMRTESWRLTESLALIILLCFPSFCFILFYFILL